MNATRSTKPAEQFTPDAPPALFHSVRAALAFAYSIGEFPIASSPKLTPSIGSGNSRLSGMSPQEKHAQGALIRRAAEERLDGMDLAVTFAFYGAGAKRTAAVKEVSREVAKLIRRSGLGMELARRILAREGDRRSQAELAADFGLSQQMISRLEAVVGAEIDRLREHAEASLEGMFVRTGIADGL